MFSDTVQARLGITTEAFSFLLSEFRVVACPCGGCIGGASRTVRNLTIRLREAEKCGPHTVQVCSELLEDLADASLLLVECEELRAADPRFKDRALRFSSFGPSWPPPRIV